MSSRIEQLIDEIEAYIIIVSTKLFQQMLLW